MVTNKVVQWVIAATLTVAAAGGLIAASADWTACDDTDGYCVVWDNETDMETWMGGATLDPGVYWATEATHAGHEVVAFLNPDHSALTLTITFRGATNGWIRVNGAVIGNGYSYNGLTAAWYTDTLTLTRTGTDVPWPGPRISIGIASSHTPMGNDDTNEFLSRYHLMGIIDQP